MLAEVHRGQRDRRVHVIGCGDDDRVDVLLLVEHLAVVLVAGGARQVLVLQPLHPSDGERNALAIDRGQRRFRPSLRVEAWRRPIEPLLLAADVGVEGGERLVRVVPIDVAQRDDVLAGEVDQVGATLSADADRGDVEQVARRREAAAENMTRDDREPGGGSRDVGDEVAPGDFRHRCLQLPQLIRWPQLSKLADPDVAERERALVIALKPDMAGLGAAELRPRLEFGRLRLSLPSRGSTARTRPS